MKKLFIFIIALAISLSVNAQSYDNLWKEFDDNIENLLPESANKTLDKIEKQAKKDKNDIQILKTILKRCEVLTMTEEKPEDTIYRFGKSCLPKLSDASQVVLNVELARYSLVYDDIIDYKDNDFIKTVSMENYADIFQKDDDESVFDIDLEPTLYDYAMHCLIKRYYYYNIENELYEKLLKFDLDNNFIKAYYNNRMNRLGYITDKNYDDFSNLSTECTDNEIVAKIKIKQIEYLTYVNVDKIKVENALVKAKQLCDEAMALLDKNHPLYKQCLEYEKSLTKKTIYLQMSNVCVPNQPIPVGLSYRNTSNPSYKIFKVSAKEFIKMKGLDNEELRKVLLSKKAVVENTVKATIETDYEEHSSLIALPALQNGQYYLVFSNNDKFTNIEDLLFTPFQVSNLSYVTLSTKDHLNAYVVNRETGAPISGVIAHFSQKEYNYKTKEYEYRDLFDTVSDKNGIVTLFKDPYGYFSIDLFYKNDTLLACSKENFSINNMRENMSLKTDIFTDRAIYRPGQTVHFKGVILRESKTYKEILPDYELVVNFFDPYYQFIDSLRVKSDEYGAFYGSFIIPTDRVRGNYSIDFDGISSNSVSFRVEEYKRPTFEVTFNTPEQEYKVGDSVTVSGKVAALSGFGLDNVKFKYHVTRKTFFPFRYWGWAPYYVQDEKISSGESTTLNDGSFSFDIQLKSDDSKVSNIPKYTYEIVVESTNKQGETQSGTLSVSATYNKYILTVETEDNQYLENPSLDINDFKNLHISATNISDKPVSTKVECKVFKINDQEKYPDDLGTFDRQILSDQDLNAYFPHFDYYSKGDISKSIVYQGVINVDGKAKLFHDNLKISPAKYIIELKSVDDTLSIFSDEYVVYDNKSGKMPYKSMCWTRIDKQSAQPGETINYYVGSSEKNVSALIIVQRDKTIIKSERISLNNNVYKLSYKVKEADRGQLNFQTVIVKYNTENHHVDYVEIPYKNFDLDIVLHTERDKIIPGETETWSLTVKDYKNKPVETSLMAVMYDAALDNFVKHKWNFDTKPHNIYSSLIKSNKSFEKQIHYQTYNIHRFNIDENKVFSSASLILSQKYRMKNEAEVFYHMRETVMDAVASTGKMMQNVTEKLTDSHENPPMKIRKDFNETAFFFPNLRTDKNGDCTFTFTMPDALTRWNLKLLAYSKDLKVGNFEKTIVTQQPLMIMADMPRFAYDEDTLWIAANVINLSEKALSPCAKLMIFDENNNPIELILSEQNINISEIPAGRSQSVRWKVAMKKYVNLLTFRFSAITDSFSDAEQHQMPVLSSEVYLTQTYALTAKPHTVKEYDFDIDRDGERNHKITLHFNENPLWTAIHAMPYVAEGDEKYAMTAFYRYFVNRMAKQIMESHPEIAEKLENTYKNDTLSELQKYEDLKAIILQETPWVLEAQHEAAQRAAIAKLFDTEAVNDNIASAYDLLASKQTPNGGWSWIDGCPESVLITQYILTGLGQLGTNDKMTEAAFHFIENDVIEDYDKLDTKKKRNNYHCGWTTMRSLYAMSYFDYKTSWKYDSAKRFFVKKLKKDWKHFSFEERAYIALILNRNGEKKAAKKIVQSLREFAIKNELGMYWRNCGLLAETRILEAFNEIDPRIDEIDAMRLWILTQKRTNMWESERASVEAILALVNTGSDWTDDGNVTITVVDDYTHAVIDNQSGYVAWGGLYRQYFVPIDYVSQHKDKMSVTRKFVFDDEKPSVGDKVKIEITFENNQDMEFVYLKDLRGACFEPKEQMSEYRWDDGLWYYQSTSDVAMEFFFEYLPKGKHTVSYEVYVTKEGSFSGGYSLIQCQYAPEFGAYSNGMRITIFE